MTTTPDPKTVREIAITDEVVREQAREIILSHAKDVEYMSIGEMIADYDEFSSLPEDEFAHVQGRIDKQIRHATVTVSWPDEQPQDELAAELVATKDALNAAYRERAHLVALLATWYPSHIGHTDPNAPDWAVVTVELRTGQACWHIAPADMDLFGHVQPTPRDARSWDGHSTEEKYRRVDQLAASVAAAKGDVVMTMRTEPQDEVERYKTFLRLRQEHGEGAACAAVYGGECKQHGEQPQDAQPWPRAQRMPLAIVGQYVQPWHHQAIAAYDEATGNTTLPHSNLPGMYAAAQVNQAIAWWNERADSEQPQDERDGDVRAVATFLASDALGPAMVELHDRFAERIAALEARDAKEA